MSGKIRDFGTGATRDTDEGKLDYEGFLSPIILERYAQYMNKHRKQSDGSLRDSDNWQQLFGDNHCNVCMKSLYRHFIDLCMWHDGFEGRDNIEEALCAILFNANAYLFKLLLDKRNNETKKMS